MENIGLLSVVVPVYKVEQYLDVCVKSIMNQTYPYLEIILVDDGSPDACPNMCDKYARMDRRISVIHQNNQGLSQARNRGILEATGDFITFIDSDDFLADDAYECMMRVMVENKCDIVACKMQTFVDGTQPFVDNEKLKFKVMKRNEALKCYMYENRGIDVVACNKIYRKSLFEGVRYPAGRLFEDFIPTTQLLLVTDTVASIENCKYYYRKRTDSINGKSFNGKVFNKKTMDLDLAVDGALKLVKAYDEYIAQVIVPAVLNAKLSIVNQMLRSDCLDEEYAKNISDNIKMEWVKILKNPYMKLNKKIQLFLFKNLNIYKVIYALFCKIK